MSPHAYTEDQLVEQPAIGLFAALGWQTMSAMEETFGAGGTLGRETKSEVVLTDRLRTALTQLNPGLPAEAIQTAIDELVRDRSAMSLEAANREVYRLLKDGIPVSVPDHDHGGQKTERLRVVDWAHPENNDFLLVSQLSVVGSLYTCRPDLGLWCKILHCRRPWRHASFRSNGRAIRRAPFRCGDCGVVRSVVPELQAELPGLGQHDGRAGHQSGAHDDSAMGTALHAGVREALETVCAPGGWFLADG